MDDGPKNGESVEPAIPEAGEHMQPQGTAPQQEKDVECAPMSRGSGDTPNPPDTESKQWENTVPDAEDQSTAAEQSERKHSHIHPIEDGPRFTTPPEHQHQEQALEVPKSYDYASTIASLEQEITTLKQSADRERNELNRKLQGSALKIQKLNQIIVKQSSQPDEPDDDQIKKESREIRRLIESIIRDNYGSGVSIGRALAKSSWPPELLELYPHCSAGGVLYLLMSHVFKLLNDWIFNACCFGLDRDMEEQMQKFERKVTASAKVDNVEAVEWRRLTVSCALRLTTNTQARADYVSRVLQQFLAPMKITRITSGPKTHDEAGPDELLFSSLFNLCTKAIMLALRFRASPTTYTFKAYDVHTAFVHCDPSLVEKRGSEGRISEPEDPRKQKILGTLFGALVKTRSSALGKEPDVVLLEGHVIVYEKLQH